MQSLHKNLLDEIGNNLDAIELYENLIDVATKYAAIRTGWLRMSREEKMESDSGSVNYSV